MQAKSRTLILIFVSFILGGIAGGFIDRAFFSKQGTGRSSRSAVMKEFTEKLKLTESQSAAVDSILESHRAKFGEIRKEYSETVKMQRDTLRRAIRVLLNDEQNALYDQYIKEMDERESRYRKENR